MPNGVSIATPSPPVPRGRDLKRQREKLGLSVSELARIVGTHPQTIDKIEREQIKFSRYHETIVKALETQHLATPEAANTKPLRPPPHSLTLPVYNSTLGFDAEGQRLDVMNAQPFAHWNTETLAVPNAYAVEIANDLMAPAFRAGDWALLDPNATPIENREVVVRCKDARWKLVRLDRITPGEWECSIYNPRSGENGKLTLSRNDYPQCHTVIHRIYSHHRRG